MKGPTMEEQTVLSIQFHFYENVTVTVRVYRKDGKLVMQCDTEGYAEDGPPVVIEESDLTRFSAMIGTALGGTAYLIYNAPPDNHALDELIPNRGARLFGDIDRLDFRQALLAAFGAVRIDGVPGGVVGMFDTSKDEPPKGKYN